MLHFLMRSRSSSTLIAASTRKSSSYAGDPPNASAWSARRINERPGSWIVGSERSSDCPLTGYHRWRDPQSTPSFSHLDDRDLGDGQWDARGVGWGRWPLSGRGKGKPWKMGLKLLYDAGCMTHVKNPISAFYEVCMKAYCEACMKLAMMRTMKLAGRMIWSFLLCM